MCVEDELLEPPRRGHSTEGLRAASLMKKAPGRQARRPEGSGERDGRELSGCGSGCECVGVQVVRRACVSTGGDPSRARESEQAREVCLAPFGLLLLGGIRDSHSAGDAGRTDSPGGRGRRRTDPRAEAVQGQTEGAATSRLRPSKGKPAIWGAGSPPLPSPQPPSPPHPRAPGRPFGRPEPVLVAPCAAALPGLGQTASSLLGDGVPQPVASPRLLGRGGGRAETAAASFVDVAWQPPRRCWATPADCSLS